MTVAALNLTWFLRMKIRQVWVPYFEWEDYLSGMWRRPSSEEKEGFLEMAIEFTGDWVLYGAAMRDVIFAWPRTMLNSLTNPAINHRAFIGHCACCYAHNMPESITRQAWAFLTDEQRYMANREAQNAFESWKIWHYNKRQLKIPFLEYAERMP